MCVCIMAGVNAIYLLEVNVCHWLCVWGSSVNVHVRVFVTGQCVSLTVSVGSVSLYQWPVCVTVGISGQCVSLTVSVGSVCHYVYQWAVCVTVSVTSECHRISGQRVSLCVSVTGVSLCVSVASVCH